MDLLDVMKKRLNEAGFTDVYTKEPNGQKHANVIVLSFGIPDRKKRYFDGAEVSPTRVTVVVARVSELDAMNDAMTAERVLATSPLDSEDGSYSLTGFDSTTPRPIPLNDPGRFIWAFDVYIDTDNRKDLF